MVAFTIVFIAVLMLKIVIVHCLKPGNRTLGQKLRAKRRQITSKIAGIACTALVVASIFFLRTMVGGVDCSLQLDGDMYLDREPETRCDREERRPDDPENYKYYDTIWKRSWIGMGVFASAFVLLCLGMRFGKRETFNFLAEKMAPQWFWWELVLLARKLSVMVVALKTSEHPEQGWFLCSFVLVIALSAHSFARPYREGWLNTCEYSSLFSTLLLFQAGMVFMQDADQNSDLANSLEDYATAIDTEEATENMAENLLEAEVDTSKNSLAALAKMLVYLAIVLISMTAGLCVFVAAKLMCERQRTYAERRKRQIAAESAASGQLEISHPDDLTDSVPDHVIQRALKYRMQADGASPLVEVQGSSKGQSSVDVRYMPTEKMLEMLASRSSAPSYAPPTGGASATTPGAAFAQVCKFCGRSQGTSAAAAASPQLQTPGQLARSKGDWRGAMSAEQRESRLKYREMLLAKQRAGKKKRALGRAKSLAQMGRGVEPEPEVRGVGLAMG